MSECEYSGRRCFLIPPGENLGIKQCSDHVDPDGHTYMRCEYFSNRTRIRCSSVRRAHELTLHGFCEKHGGYIERLRRAAARTRRILDPGYMVDNGLDANCSSDEYDEVLEDSHENWPYVFESLYCDTRIDNSDNPLRNAGVYTEKEAVMQYIDAIERQKEALLNLRIIYAEKHRRLIAARALEKKNGDAENKKPLLDTKNAPSKNKKLRERYKAYAKYGSYLHWRRSVYFSERASKRTTNDGIGAEVPPLDTAVPSTSGCQFVERVNVGKPLLPAFEAGKAESECTDEMEIANLLTRVVDYVDMAEKPREDVIEKVPCSGTRVPLSDFCVKHILVDDSQYLFNKCVECDKPAMFFSEYRRCRPHYEKLIAGPVKSSSSIATVQQNVTIGDDLDSDLYLQMCTDMAKTEQQQVKYHQQQQQQQQSSFFNTSRAVPSSTDKLLIPANAASNSMPLTDSHHIMRPSPGPTMMYSQHQYSDVHQLPQYRSVRYQPKPGILYNAERESTCARIRPFNGNHGGRRVSSSSMSGTMLYHSPHQHQLGGPPMMSPRTPQSSGFSHMSPSASQQHVYSPPLSGDGPSSYSSMKFAEGIHHQEVHPHHPPPSPAMHIMPRRIPSQINTNQPTAFPYPIVPTQRRPPPASPMVSARGASSMVRIMRGVPVPRGTTTARRGPSRGTMLQSQLHLPFNQRR